MGAEVETFDRLPCVVQVGFAGARKFLANANEWSGLTPQQESQLLKELVEIVRSLPAKLKLGNHHFLCGISQIAIGSDMLFTCACQALGITQRIFLPQHLDAYLSAVGSGGEPDFDGDQRTAAMQILKSAHIIQERMVSDSPSRHERFEECNREILRVSDVVICVLQTDVSARPGGTKQLLDLAKRQGKAVLEVRIQFEGNDVRIEPDWLPLNSFVPPSLPSNLGKLHMPAGSELSAASLPTVGQFCTVVKDHVSERAKQFNKLFSSAALVIIATHGLATLLATFVLSKDHEPGHSIWTTTMLVFEFVLLVLGFLIHHWVHRFKPSKSWAVARLLAEINRSVRSLGNLHVYLGYLFRLDLPTEFVPLLRTLNVLHLRTTRPFRDGAWTPLLAPYVQNRLDDPNPQKGQIAYHRDRRRKAHLYLRACHWLFMFFCSLAILATGIEVIILCGYLRISAAWQLSAEPWLGVFTVLFPVLAVGFLTWAAAKDYEARVHTYGKMVDFLKRQRTLLLESSSFHEFRDRVAETELKLLSETAQWYARRTFTGVA